MSPRKTIERRPGFFETWSRFWFLPVDPIGLHGLRTFVGLLVLAWLLGFAGSHDALFGLDGWFDLQAYRESGSLTDRAPIPIGWSPLFLSTTPWLVHAFYGVALLSVTLFIAGVYPSVTGVFTWLAVVAFTQNPVVSYGGDTLLLILTFYLMVGYLIWGAERFATRRGAWAPWRPDFTATRFFGADSNSARTDSAGANVALRLVQVHMAIVLLTSGLHKLQMSVWWAGAALWFPLHPPFETSLESLGAIGVDPVLYMGVLSLGAYCVMAWQMTFPFFAWRANWRPFLLVTAAFGWVGCRFLYCLPIFGPGLFLACLAYLGSPGWYRIAKVPRAVVDWARRPSNAAVAPRPTLEAPTG